MNNYSKKGFTLMELLAVIVILAIIALIAVPKILNVIDQIRLEAYYNQEKAIVNAAQLYTVNKLDNFPTEPGCSVVIPLEKFKQENLLNEIKDPKGSDSCDGYIIVEKTDDNEFQYDSYIKCSDNYTTEGYTEGYTKKYLSVENLILWLDSTKSETLTLDENNRISQWSDLSSKCNNAFQTDNQLQPILTNDGISFDQLPENTKLSLSDTINMKDFTIFVVYKSESYENQLHFIMGQDNHHGVLVGGMGEIGEGRWRYPTIAVYDYPHIARSDMKSNLGEQVVLAVTNEKIFVNGTETGYDLSTSYGELHNIPIEDMIINTIGDRESSNTPFIGQLYEILIYERNLSDEERQSVEQYLGEKWLTW